MLLSTHALRYFFMISRSKYTKNVLVGSLAALVRDKIHCYEYPGTRRVMSVVYPGSKLVLVSTLPMALVDVPTITNLCKI